MKTDLLQSHIHQIRFLWIHIALWSSCSLIADTNSFLSCCHVAQTAGVLVHLQAVPLSCPGASAVN
jgi:hypothetical protein